VRLLRGPVLARRYFADITDHYQLKARMRLPISDYYADILSRTVSKLSQIIVWSMNTLHFWAPFGGLWQRTLFTLGSLENS